MPATKPPNEGPQDRRLRLEEILTLMVADGLVAAADADTLARAPARRAEHPLEIIAEKNWHAANGAATRR